MEKQLAAFVCSTKMQRRKREAVRAEGAAIPVPYNAAVSERGTECTSETGHMDYYIS